MKLRATGDDNPSQPPYPCPERKDQPMTFVQINQPRRQAMNLVVRDPFWKQFGALSNSLTNLNRVFDASQGDDDSDSLGSWSPRVDIYDNGSEVQLQAELPGINKEDIDIRVENNVLTLRGKRERNQEVKDNGYFRTERSYGSFSRSFSLSNTVEVSKIEADYKDGVLNLVLPKAEEAKPKHIEVKVG